MSEYQVKRKKVKLIPTVGSLPEQTVEVPENTSISEAIGRVFGQKLKDKRIVVQNEKDEPVSPDTKVSEVDEVKITPFTEGGKDEQ